MMRRESFLTNYPCCKSGTAANGGAWCWL